MQGAGCRAQGSKHLVEGVRSIVPKCGYKIEFDSYALGLKN